MAGRFISGMHRCSTVRTDFQTHPSDLRRAQSLIFLIGVVSLFLLTFVIEGQSFLRRVAFLLLELGITGYYIRFLQMVMRGSKGEKK